MSSKFTLVATAITLLTLTSCKDERPPRWSEICVKHKTELVMAPYYDILNGSFSMKLQPRKKCIEHKLVCVIGEDYTGLGS
jgi:hypothetical protein